MMRNDKQNKIDGAFPSQRSIWSPGCWSDKDGLKSFLDFFNVLNDKAWYVRYELGLTQMHARQLFYNDGNCLSKTKHLYFYC